MAVVSLSAVYKRGLKTIGNMESSDYVAGIYSLTQSMDSKRPQTCAATTLIGYLAEGVPMA